MDMRAKILHIIRDFPGLHLRELARQADTSLHLVQYHAQRLQDEGDIEMSLEGGKVRAFPPGLSRPERAILGALRDKQRARIVLTLLEQAPVSHGDLVKRLKISKSTLSFHLRNLEDQGVIDREGQLRLRDVDGGARSSWTLPLDAGCGRLHGRHLGHTLQGLTAQEREANQAKHQDGARTR